jgi:hypothetical protein
LHEHFLHRFGKDDATVAAVTAGNVRLAQIRTHPFCRFYQQVIAD